MNEFERRQLQVAQNHKDIRALVNSMGRNVTIEHFGYSLRIGSETDPLLAADQRSGFIAMQSDAWFVLQYVSSCVILPSTSWYFRDSGNINLQITDTGAGDTIYSGPSSAGVLTATISRPQPGVPFLLPIPRAIPPNTNIKVDATQIGASVDNEEPVGFFISLMGSRVAMV